ncbi:MAG: hypothetical protein ACFUZC_19235 [Chthoniobacteraceae bacterium]
MKRTILTLALVAATSAITALAQDATPTPSATPAEGPRHHREGGKDHGGPGGPFKEALEALTPAEREQLKAAHQKAKDDPALVEARKKAEAARKAVAEAEKAALLKADPSIGPVLDKLEAARKAHRPPEGAPMPPPGF